MVAAPMPEKGVSVGGQEGFDCKRVPNPRHPYHPIHKLLCAPPYAYGIGASVSPLRLWGGTPKPRRCSLAPGRANSAKGYATYGNDPMRVYLNRHNGLSPGHSARGSDRLHGLSCTAVLLCGWSADRLSARFPEERVTLRLVTAEQMPLAPAFTERCRFALKNALQ